ncbi:MAG: DUF1957 domain-containing protein [Firmicutes bacterium]|nr:DUF1957 domain-containing protein [Bacillota bacterium]
MRTVQGNVAFVLHAHLPYVRHPEDPDALEHRWLYEALTESYLPLLLELQALAQDGVPFRMTLSLSPTLIAMLEDEWLHAQYEDHLCLLIELAGRERVRTGGDSGDSADGQQAVLAQFYEERLQRLLSLFRRYHGKVVNGFRELQEAGHLDLITCGATHAFSPFLASKEALRAQVGLAIASHVSVFGRTPAGYWLPECAYAPGVDEVLAEFGLTYFFVGETAYAGASPQPPFGAFSPVMTAAGVIALAGDQELARQVWSSSQGYPGDPDYREYYRDIGFDLDAQYIAPFIHPDGIRVNTGLKYHRVTGTDVHKDWYRPEWAAGKTREHARHFAALCRDRVARGRAEAGREPLLVIPFDAELFGHWWFEGPQWLGHVFRELHGDAHVGTLTPSDYLMSYPDYPVCDLPQSTWGRGGFADVWLNETNDWVYPALHTAERRMIKLAKWAQDANCTHLEQRAVLQAARELMLAEASDWAFMMDGKTTVDYAIRRTKSHVNRFTRLYDMLRSGSVNEDWLKTVEESDALFPLLDVRFFCSPESATLPYVRGVSRKAAEGGLAHAPATRMARTILLLSWEYPPLMVGGLSRHVYDLSRYLARDGSHVHVITTFGGEGELYECIEGVHVHRVNVLQPDGGEFIHWTLAMNLAMVTAARDLISDGVVFDLVHAHDWLVGYAAHVLKERYGLPLVATIHATEHGRNGGIFSDLQRQISAIEWALTYEAREVIVCSTYMRRELEDTFSLPTSKQHVIANGVDPDLFGAAAELAGRRGDGGEENDPVIVFVGRLVREKGVQTLVEAMPVVLASCPGARAVIIGKGPMMGPWQARADELGIRDHVLFTGFVTDAERNHWLTQASVAVFPSLYEPFGIVALEAMAMGIPVVVSDVGGLADVVSHEVNGLKSLPGDADSLATQIVRLLQNHGEARRFADRATAELSRYDWALIAAQTQAVYDRVLTVPAAAEADTG